MASAETVLETLVGRDGLFCGNGFPTIGIVEKVGFAAPGLGQRQFIDHSAHRHSDVSNETRDLVHSTTGRQYHFMDGDVARLNTIRYLVIVDSMGNVFIPCDGQYHREKLPPPVANNPRQHDREQWRFVGNAQDGNFREVLKAAMIETHSALDLPPLSTRGFVTREPARAPENFVVAANDIGGLRAGLRRTGRILANLGRRALGLSRA